MKSLTLTIDLVPETCWFNNLRTKMTQTNWDKVRKQAYAQYNNVCGVCGDAGQLNCHEVWEYDDTNFRQTLQGFIALCNMCHHVKHIGWAGILAKEGKLDFDTVVAHFLKVNNCDMQTFEKHYEEAFRIWRERSLHQWKTDFGRYANLISHNG